VMVVDDREGSGKRQIGPSSYERYQKLQDEHGMNFTATIKTAKAKKTHVFPFMIVHVGVVEEQQLVTMMKSCDLPFVDAYTIRGLNTKMSEDQILSAIGVKDMKELEDDQKFNEAVQRMLRTADEINFNATTSTTTTTTAITPATMGTATRGNNKEKMEVQRITGQHVRQAWNKVLQSMVFVTKTKLAFSNPPAPAASTLCSAPAVV